MKRSLKNVSESEPREHEADEVERWTIVLAKIRNEARGEPDAEKADRDIDPEDPAPVEIGGDEAAEHRAEHGSDQRRHGQIGEGAHEIALRHGAQDDEPSHRNHHGSARALKRASRHEAEERVGEAAGDGAEREHADRGAKDGARTEPVGAPAADRDEHGERQQIGGEGKLQVDRIDVEVDGDRRERGRDHRAVDILHEESAGDDERQKERA